jgi:hypothetical protein
MLGLRGAGLAGEVGGGGGQGEPTSGQQGQGDGVVRHTHTYTVQTGRDLEFSDNVGGRKWGGEQDRSVTRLKPDRHARTYTHPPIHPHPPTDGRTRGEMGPLLGRMMVRGPGQKAAAILVQMQKN